MIASEKLKTMTIELIKEVTSLCGIAKESELDKKAEPLIAQLIEEKFISTNDAFVEWAGVFEFNLIAVCHYKDGKQTWIQLYNNGVVEIF